MYVPNLVNLSTKLHTYFSCEPIDTTKNECKSEPLYYLFICGAVENNASQCFLKWSTYVSAILKISCFEV